MGLVDDREEHKQRSEIAAWVDIARSKGEGFMRGTEVQGDVAPYRDKVIIDLGCGPRPFVEHFPARLSFMMDCCMLGYRDEGLIQESSLAGTCLVDAMAERLPVRDGVVDYVFSINMLDHTFDPAAVVAEMGRVLRPGGEIHLNVDVGGEPNECEPVVFTDESLTELFRDYQPIYTGRRDASNPGRDHMVIAVLRKTGGEEGAPGDGASTYLDILACPDCGRELSRDENRLTCPNAHEHRIDRGIWILRPS